MKLNYFTSNHLAAAIAAILVSYGSSAVIVFQAAQAFGGTPEQINSWFTSLGIACGVLTIALSWKYKTPIMFAWCTPGAALMVSLTGIPMDEAVMAFIFAGALMLVVSLSGFFDRIVALIPSTLASAMLAGILINFGSKVFVSMESQTILVVLMLLTYLLSKFRFARYSLLLMLSVGFTYAYFMGLLKTEALHWQAPTLMWLEPSFNLQSIISVGIPLFITALVSQNVPGMAILRAYQYDAPGKPLVNSSALATVLLAPFGAFMVNLAAISASLTLGAEVDNDPSKRYRANLIMGVFYLILAACGGMVVSLFAALPGELLWALAGIAIFGTLISNIDKAWSEPATREASLITLLASASGMTLWGIGSAFWGLLIGVGVYHLNQKIKSL